MKLFSALMVFLLSEAVLANNGTRLKISFTENKGQIYDQNYKPRADVLFSGTDGQLTFHIKNNGISYQLNKVVSWKEELLPGKQTQKISVPDRSSIYRIDANWLNTNPNTTIKTGKALKGYSNYYLEQCPDGALHVKAYEDITFEEIYPGIDLHYYEENIGLKYDYLVKANADLKKIKIEIKGAEIVLRPDGSLLLRTSIGDVCEGKPIAFQDGKQIKADWVIEGNIISFKINDYDHTKELVIDPPTRAWGTFYGGNGSEIINQSTSDASGNTYVTGITTTPSGTAIATSGSHQFTYGGTGVWDAFLAKFDSSGVRLWGTYYGSVNNDYGMACTTDNQKNVYMSGQARSVFSGVISTPGAHQVTYGGGTFDAYIAKFDSMGVRLWGTYYGGTGDDNGYACATDKQGNVYMVGYTTTSSGTIIATAGSYQSTFGGGNDSYLVKFNSSGVRQWATYFGGPNNDLARSCSIDNDKNIYLAGATNSTFGMNIASPGSHQPVYGGGSYDGFLVKFDSTGFRKWGTYYGGSGYDEGNNCIVDVYNDVYLIGDASTNTGTAIATPGSYQSSHGGGNYDMFLAKFNSSGVRLSGTYYGSTGDDFGMWSAGDGSGNIYLSGMTTSTAGIISIGAYQTIYGGGYNDATLLKLNNNGILQWSTYYGGTGEDRGYSCLMDCFGSIYMSGPADVSVGTAIATPGSHQPVNGGGGDGYLVKFIDCITAPVAPAAITGSTYVCIGSNNTYSIPVIPSATSYTWSLPAGWSGTSSSNIINVISSSISGTISVYARNACGTSTVVALSVSINPNPTPTVMVNSGTICNGQSFTITPSGASTYTFSSGSSVVSPLITSSYTVVGMSTAGCISNSVVSNVSVNPLPTVTAITSSTLICGPPFQGTVTFTGGGASTYTWSTSSIANTIAVSPSVTTTYTVTGTDSNSCQNTATITQNVSACTSVNFLSNYDSEFNIYPNPTDGKIYVVAVYENIEVYNMLGELIYFSELRIANHELDLSKQPSGVYFIKAGKKTRKIIKK